MERLNDPRFLDFGDRQGRDFFQDGSGRFPGEIKFSGKMGHDLPLSHRSGRLPLLWRVCTFRREYTAIGQGIQGEISRKFNISRQG